MIRESSILQVITKDSFTFKFELMIYKVYLKQSQQTAATIDCESEYYDAVYLLSIFIEAEQAMPFLEN